MASFISEKLSGALLPLVIAASTGAAGGYYFGSQNLTISEDEVIAQQDALTSQGDVEFNAISHSTLKKADKTSNKHSNQKTAKVVNAQGDIVPEGTFYTDFNENVEVVMLSVQTLPELLAARNFKALAKLKQSLLSKVKADSAALDELVLALQDNLQNEDVKEQLLQVLAQVKDPKVEQMAQDLALSSSREDKLTGLNLLGDLNMANDETLNIAVSALDDNTDGEMLQAAMRAMPNMQISSEQNGEILSRLNDLAQNKDESVRSESLFAIAKQAKTPEQLKPLMSALNSASIDEQISAAMAIEKSTVTSDELKRSLIAQVSNPQSLPEVRAMSANALTRFSLSSAELDVVAKFKQTQQWNGGS